MIPNPNPMAHTFKNSAETRRIYSVIFEPREAPPPQTILITSGWRGEGKTTLACNLAVLASREKAKKILLMDCNGFAPGVHTRFGIPSPLPLMHANPAKGLPGTLTQMPTMGDLSILAAGLPSQTGEMPTDPFGFMHDARKEYDHIIIDTSSVFPTNRHMNDPMLLSKMADGVVLVALTNVTQRAKTKRACCALQSNGANILGVVANQWQNPLSV